MVDKMFGNDGKDQIATLTFPYIKPETDFQCDWAYHLFRTHEDIGLRHLARASGSNGVCECAECISFEGDLRGAYSIIQAVNWVKFHNPTSGLFLYVKSKRLLAQLLEPKFESYQTLYSCKFLRNLGDEFRRFMSEIPLTIIPV